MRRLNAEGHTIVLTTHYLEEAQQLCGRIGLLKGGRLIALDRTRALIDKLAGVQMALRLKGELPASLRPLVTDDQGGRVLLRLAQPADVEPALAACRDAGCAITEIEVGHADLEDVFLKLIHADRVKEAA